MEDDERFKYEMTHSKNFDLTRELNELHDQELIKHYNIIYCEFNRVKFTITTLENNILQISTDVNECYKVEEDDTLFENFEQLLNKHSKAYSIQFSKILYDRLDSLSKN